jgi:hypothetical protein
MWTCEKCGKPHDSDEVRLACRRRERRFARWAFGVFVLLAVAVLAIDIVANQWAYGDWKCAFVKCVVVK